jgi:hydrogenase-4 component F
MTLLALVIVPALGALSLLTPALRGLSVEILIGTAIISLAFAVWIAMAPPADGAGVLRELERVDVTSRLFLPVINAIFLGVSVYVWTRAKAAPSLRGGMSRFGGLALAFLGAANAVLISGHLLVLWLALEVTTFAAAALIIRPGAPASRQASFRYVLFSSIGLGLALLGLRCLARGAEASGYVASFSVEALPQMAADAHGAWGKLGLAFMLLGLGAKLGLAPMYSWLPETYDEAPPAVAALLGAVQFNCVLVTLFRVVQACRPTQPGLIMGELLTMGIASMTVSIGLGLGKGASFGLLIYVLSNAFIKAILFLTAGKIKAHYGTKDTRQISGLIKDLPYSGVFLMVGTFALLGFPPFGSFVGELLILSALVGSGQIMVFATFCILMAMTFVATGRTIFPMIWGQPRATRAWPRQTFVSASPKLIFLVCLVVLGVYVPPSINGLLQQVATSLEGP